MASTDEASYLTNWTEIMQGENRLNVVRWLSGGSIENESMVVAHLKHFETNLLDRMPELDSVIYTNSVDVDGWRGSYVVPHRQSGHVWEKGVDVAVSMWEEEGLSADLYICNGAASAMALYGMGLAWYNRSIPPIICVFALSPRPGEYWSYTTPEHTLDFFRFAGSIDSFWMVTVDRDREVEALKLLMRRAGHTHFDRIRRATTWAWDRARFPSPRRDVVIWSGRSNTVKNPQLAADIFQQMPVDVVKEVFSPRAQRKAVGTAGGAIAKFSKIPNTTVYDSVPPDEYRQMAGTAKILLVTSRAEAAPIGYIELMGMGVLPVISDEDWVDADFIPDSWPLRFKTIGEAVEMCAYGMENYDKLKAKLRAWMGKRYTTELPFADVVQEVWEHHTVQLGDRVRLIGERGDRKGL